MPSSMAGSPARKRCRRNCGDLRRVRHVAGFGCRQRLHRVVDGRDPVIGEHRTQQVHPRPASTVQAGRAGVQQDHRRERRRLARERGASDEPAEGVPDHMHAGRELCRHRTQVGRERRDGVCGRVAVARRLELPAHVDRCRRDTGIGQRAQDRPEVLLGAGEAGHEQDRLAVVRGRTAERRSARSRCRT